MPGLGSHMRHAWAPPGSSFPPPAGPGRGFQVWSGPGTLPCAWADAWNLEPMTTKASSLCPAKWNPTTWSWSTPPATWSPGAFRPGGWAGTSTRFRPRRQPSRPDASRGTALIPRSDHARAPPTIPTHASAAAAALPCSSSTTSTTIPPRRLPPSFFGVVCCSKRHSNLGLLSSFCYLTVLVSVRRLPLYPCRHHL